MVAALAVGASLLVGSCSTNADDGAESVSPTALDLLAPVNREQANQARVALDDAIWATFEPAWRSCVATAGHTVDPAVGKELSYLGYTANVDFLAPSTIRKEGGASHVYSAGIRALSEPAATAVAKCNDLLKASAEGDSDRAVDSFASGVDPAKFEAVRDVRSLMGSSASTLRELSDASMQHLANGAWKGMPACLAKNGVVVSSGAINDPRDMLEELSARFAGGEDAAGVAAAIAEAQPRLEAFIRCSQPFYDSLTPILEKARNSSVENHRQAYEDMSAALAVLGAGGS